jgi:hypothetical protein
VKVSIESLKDKYRGIDDEFQHEAELLIILFNFWPEVQRRWLMKLRLKPAEIETVMKVSDLFAKKKVQLMNDKVPVNRKGIILVENDVMESLYDPRIIRVLENDRKDALKIAKKYLGQEHADSVIIDQAQIDKLEDIMRLQDRSVDFLIFSKNKIISYQVELI